MARNEQGEKNQQEEPKIIVDDDWKAQAQAEKEKLSEQVQKEAAEGKPAEARPRELPPAGIPTLISTLVTQVYLELGGLEDPKTKRRYVDLDLAKHHIDMLAVIEEKTKGNLSDEEKKLLDQALYETRMQYVHIAQHATRVEVPEDQ